MYKAYKARKETKKWRDQYVPLAPKVGDVAPDFELHDVSGNKAIRLSDYRDKQPVALIFGSYTWPPFADGTVSLRDIYEKYHDKVQFIMIYIREAHPIDGWWLGGGLFGLLLKIKGTKAIKDIYDPKTIDDRKQVASRCASELDYGIPTLVDDIDDPANRAYAAIPTRMFLIGIDGRVVYAGGLGPWGFKPKELKIAIEKMLNKNS